VTSQALKYDVITYTPSEDLNYTILDKITPLSKRIGGPSEIQIGQGFSTWGSRIPGVHGKIFRGTWIAVEFSCILIF